ncbi:hypothetical protein AG1IA_09973 [Rhizoctonia solani AG-1 IA]|uniref:Uncharacterized protein n=1 Tax=Thanatephorus cucumeris (strain AG1-IA) TaxID=983506 RepID=L8WGZ1_THACA|nr:hypothetical protein AG1IA_09973 [Rhizoctonia solani AG-1 IA]
MISRFSGCLGAWRDVTRRVNVKKVGDLQRRVKQRGKFDEATERRARILTHRPPSGQIFKPLAREDNLRAQYRSGTAVGYVGPNYGISAQRIGTADYLLIIQ